MSILKSNPANSEIAIKTWWVGRDKRTKMKILLLYDLIPNIPELYDLLIRRVIYFANI
jgi:hypothetical protein